MSGDRHSSAAATTTEDNLFLDILNEAPLAGHRKPTRIYGSYAAVVVGSPWIFEPIKEWISPLLCSCNVGLLLFTGIFQQYLVYQVQKIRLQGYYSFSQKLKHIVRLPFATIAYGYVHQYNRLNSQPDVLNSLYSPLQASSSLEGLRYYDAGRLSDQQMALLQYQRENLHFLSEEILRLQESLSKYERSNDGSAPQADLAHLLASRDQELRTLSAEMDQLQSELRLARSLIAERETEVQRLRTTNIQYIEENERLRAILGEWSTRAAKLERALETERMSNLEHQKKISALRSQIRGSASDST
ncbi:FIP1-like protein [Drosera capensis]